MSSSALGAVKSHEKEEPMAQGQCHHDVTVDHSAEFRAPKPVRVAVEWWAAQLRQPPAHDILGERPALTAEDVARFRTTLYEIVVPGYEKDRQLWLATGEVGGLGDLQKAAEAAKVDIRFRLPWDAKMHVFPDYVSFDDGEKLWPSGLFAPVLRLFLKLWTIRDYRIRQASIDAESEGLVDER